MPSRSIQGVANGKTFFYSVAGWCSIVYVDHIFLTHPSALDTGLSLLLTIVSMSENGPKLQFQGRNQGKAEKGKRPPNPPPYGSEGAEAGLDMQQGLGELGCAGRPCAVV